MKRLDLYGECNVVGAPVNVFTEQCCAFCINPDCTRSTFGKSHFEQRVSTWHERLFSNVPKMEPEDPRYGQIAAQKFILIQPSLKVSDWQDAPVSSSQVAPVSMPEPPAVAPSPAPVEAPVEAQPVSQERPEPKRAATGLNTPVQQGRMLQSGGGAPGEQVVRPGARIKLGQ